MAELTFDTSGAVDFGPAPHVDLPGAFRFTRFIEWEDLPDLAQGFVEAMFASLRFVVVECSACDWDAEIARPFANWPRTPCPKCGGVVDEVVGSPRSKGFSALSPEALAAALDICARWTRKWPLSEGVEQGRLLWKLQQDGMGGEHFPPQGTHVSDDGQVHLRQATR
jgi:hypothetical protein